MTHSSLRQRIATYVAAALLTLLGALGAAPAALAEFEVKIQDAQPSQSKEAMAFSNFSLSVAFPRDSTPKSLQLDLPKGQLGVLSAAAICPRASFDADACPTSSQIGSTSVMVNTTVLGVITAPGSIYRIPTQGTEVGRLGIVVRPPIGDKMALEGLMRVRDDGSYGIRASVPEMPKTAHLTVIPGLPPVELPITLESMLMTMFGRIGNAGPAGFFFNPAECVPATTSVSSIAYDGSTDLDTFSYTPTNCAGAPFTPSVSFGPSPAPASAASELDVVVTTPFDGNAAKVQAPIRTTKIVLPPGVQLTGATNSDGQLVDCTDAQFGYANLAPATCPAGSKVGSVVMDSPLVGNVPGDVFLAKTQGGSADEIIRLFVVAQLGPEADAVRVKLLVRVEVDPVTGKMTNTLTDLPAQPVKRFAFKFRGGDSPGTRTPRLCGTYEGSAEITPFSSTTPQLKTADYVASTNCPTPGTFRPTLGMATTPTQAGAATTGVTTIALPVGDEPMTGTRVSLPPGMLANLKGVPLCSTSDAAAGTCPAESEIGKVRSLAGQSSKPGIFNGTVYLTAAPNAESLAGLMIAVPVQVGPVYVDDLRITAALVLRPDYGVDVVSAIPETIRGLQLDQQELKLTFDRADFLTNPPTCEGNTISGAFESSEGSKRTVSSPLTVTGCDALEFNPAVSFSATPASATAASGLTTKVTMAPTTSGHPQSPAKQIAVTLPKGVSVSPSAGARGDLAGCSDAQFDAATLGAPSCPAGSAVGTVSIDTPSVGQLSGTAYLGDPIPGHLARVMIDATSTTYGPNARVKLVGLLDVDEATGRTTATFDDLPPVGFTEFTLAMRGGDAPVLAMPPTCGAAEGSAELTPYAGAVATRTATLTIDQDCPDPAAFAPTVELGTSTTQAGADTALTTVVKVPAGHQALTALDLTMPRGLLGRLTVVPLCPLDRAQAGTCGEESLVGSVSAKVGVASAPFTVTGRVYMTAGDGDAIAGLAFVLPAVVGPIDLGSVVTLTKLRITGADLQLKITADAIPTQVKGIPLNIAELAIAIDKPRVVLNASSCEARSAAATFTGAGGATATGSAPYQATGCESLDWQPQMALDFTGSPAEVAVKGHPTVVTEITQAEGRGSLRTADVLLPPGVATDLKNINARSCVSLEVATAGGCGDASKVGSAVINTSALPEPVDAPIYLVKVPGQTLPGLLLRVRDQISFDSLGVNKIDGGTGRIRVTFADVPDTPISRMALTFDGGPSGLLQIGKDICGAGTTTNATLTSQHGTQRPFALPVRCNGKVSTFGGSTTLGASATLAVRPTGKQRGVTLTVKNVGGVRRIVLGMPKGFSYPRGASKAVKVKLTGGSGKKVKVTRTIKGRTLTVRIGSAKVTGVRVTVPAKAARFTSKLAKDLRKSSGQKKLRPSLTVIDDNAKVAKVTPKLTFASAKKK